MDPATMAALISAGTSIASMFSKDKKGGEDVDLMSMIPPWQRSSLEGLSNLVNTNLPNYQPGKEYSGAFTAPMSGFESTGLELLKNYLGTSATGDLYGAAKSQIMDTLGGKFADPQSSPFIKSMTNLAKMNLRDEIDRSRASAGSRGTYFTTQAMKGERDLGERTQNYLNSIIGQFSQEERNKMFQAAPMASALEEYGLHTAPLKQVAASQTFGSLPRLIEQADLETRYQDFTRKQGELGDVQNTAKFLASGGQNLTPSRYKMPYREENNTLGNILDVISKLNLGSIGQKGSTIWDIFGKQ